MEPNTLTPEQVGERLLRAYHLLGDIQELVTEAYEGAPDDSAADLAASTAASLVDGCAAGFSVLMDHFGDELGLPLPEDDEDEEG